MSPDSPVGEGINDIFQSPFISETIAILSKTTIDLCSLLVIQELGSVRIIVNLEVGPNGNDEGDDTLKDLEIVRRD